MAAQVGKGREVVKGLVGRDFRGVWCQRLDRRFLRLLSTSHDRVFEPVECVSMQLEGFAHELCDAAEEVSMLF